MPTKTTKKIAVKKTTAKTPTTKKTTTRKAREEAKEARRRSLARKLHVPIAHVRQLECQGTLRVGDPRAVEHVQAAMRHAAYGLGGDEVDVTTGSLEIPWPEAIDVAARLLELEEVCDELVRRQILTPDLELVTPNGPERLTPFGGVERLTR